MRNLIIYIAAITLLLVACEQDSYNKGEGTYSYMQADFVEAHADGEKKIDYVITDNGDSIVLSTPCAAAWAKTADSLYRATLYYNKVEGNKAHVLMIQEMMTMSLTPTDSISEMKTDPLGLEALWTDKRKRYVNMTLTLRVGTVSNDSKPHRVTLIPDSMHINGADSTRTLHLTLFHDKGDIPEYYTEKYYFSMPTSWFATTKADTLAFHINTTDGMKTMRIPLAK